MKIAAFFFVASIAQAQQSATTSGQCSPIAPNNSGSVTITCSSIDKKLASQIGQLVATSNRDAKTLKDISDKLDVLLAGQPFTITQSAPGGINSVVTGGTPTVNNTIITPHPPARHIPPDKEEQVRAILQRHHGTIRIMAIQQDQEAYNFADDWLRVFKAANWSVLDDSIRVFELIGRPEPGVLLKIRGETVNPGTIVPVLADSAEGDVFTSFALLGMTSNDVHAQRFPDLPEGQIEIEINTQPQK